jgi:hypothetical protein
MSAWCSEALSTERLWCAVVHAQVYELSQQFLPKEWIMEKWEEGFYITAMTGSTGGSSLVVMSKGTPYTQQSYKVSDSFPFKWINKKWKEGFYVTSMATSHSRWAVVMSRNAGFIDQVGGGVDSFDSFHPAACLILDSAALSHNGSTLPWTVGIAMRVHHFHPIRATFPFLLQSWRSFLATSLCFVSIGPVATAWVLAACVCCVFGD